jgi:hypothetical protein
MAMLFLTDQQEPGKTHSGYNACADLRRSEALGCEASASSRDTGIHIPTQPRDAMAPTVSVREVWCRLDAR